jgi:hypothetical protein
MMKRAGSKATSDRRSTHIVSCGYQRAVNGLESEVRLAVEKRYAEEWNGSGLIKRWFLHRRMEREIADLVAKRSLHISPVSLF